MLKKIIQILLLIPMLVLCQNEKLIKGKIVSEVADLEGVHIINISNIAASVSDKKGYFNIKATINDTLVFSAIFLERKKHVVSSEDLSNKLILISINPNTEYLKEVTLTKYPNINAVSLGILKKPAKTYTPAERKLASAGVFKWYSPLLIPFGGMSIDGLINEISGKRKRLEKELVVEQKELLHQTTLSYFNKNYIIQTLLIPEEYVSGFLHFIDDNENFARAMKEKNKTQASFLLHGLAIDYLTLKEIPLQLKDRTPNQETPITEKKE